MTRYLSISEQQIPLGKSALLLFVHRAELCAGVIEHRCDGRVVKKIAADPQPTQLVSVICQLMDGQSLDGDLLVVLDKGAYWPEAFPLLSNEKSNNFKTGL